jgi:hypothetical protein
MAWRRRQSEVEAVAKMAKGGNVRQAMTSGARREGVGGGSHQRGWEQVAYRVGGDRGHRHGRGAQVARPTLTGGPHQPFLIFKQIPMPEFKIENNTLLGLNKS